MPYDKWNVYKVDLTQFHDDYEIDFPFTVKEIKILKADSDVYIALNSPQESSEKIYCYQDLTIPVKTDKIFVTNSAGTGELRLLVMW